ncbi:MAG TPA: adenylate/guanylate cyclase domain-containing protein, partial [Mesorhizobium sp.]|nr:adenylate/guanylate cyclase domain-containing protein [Mesorhizobium sp.]
MAAISQKQLTKFIRGIGVRQIRLACGLVLFAYLVSHFLNHALGNISMDALAAGVWYHTAFWQFLPVAIVFYTAALVHAGLGIWALYERRQFRWKTIEPLQLVLGLSIPALIISHLAGVRLGHTLFGYEKLYPQVLYAYWIVRPYKMWLMFGVLTIAWTHGCIGFYFWLRMKVFYKSASPFLLSVAVLVPTLAMLGLYRGGRSVVADSDRAEWRADNLSQRQVGIRAEQDVLDSIADYFLIFYLGLLGFVLLARGARALNERRGPMISLSYGNGRTIRVPKGLSVLEASLRYNIPHASVCGGRARCSTCRIRVIGDCTSLPQPSKREAFVLSRVGAEDPSIRLACQLRPTADLSFFQLFMPHTMSANAHASNPTRFGQERYLVSMFVDMRGSARLAEDRLPFDTVFIVNRFLGAVSQAVIECGGRPNQFVGDGELALFGIATSPQTACRQALKAAAMIATNVDELNQFLSHDLREPIRFGIGIHGGEVVAGVIGTAGLAKFSVTGDPINVASRIEGLTSKMQVDLLITDDIRRLIGDEFDLQPMPPSIVKGKAEPIQTYRVG